MQTAGYLTCWAARFASVLVLRRAWVTLPLTNVLSRVQIRVSYVSIAGTLEPTPVTTNRLTTLTALLIRVLRVNLLNTDTPFRDFVRDELLEFVGRP